MSSSSSSPSCHSCSKTDCSLSRCARCKSVFYCSTACQRQDWPSHKGFCQRKEFAGAPCDLCKAELVGIEDVCLECGYIQCMPCLKQHRTLDQTGKMFVSFEPCPGCQHQIRKNPLTPVYCKKLEELIEKKKDDPRRARWLVDLGQTYLLDPSIQNRQQKAMDSFLRAGEIGFGEGYSRLAEIHLHCQNWNEARKYYRLAAEKKQVDAIAVLGTEAREGYFLFANCVSVQPKSQWRTIDLKEAYQWFREGASLEDPRCCSCLGHCFLEGQGVERNLAKGFKWVQKAAELGYADGMRLTGQCYLYGIGVENSREQAKYWFEKSLELDDDEQVRDILRNL